MGPSPYQTHRTIFKSNNSHPQNDADSGSRSHTHNYIQHLTLVTYFNNQMPAFALV